MAFDIDQRYRIKRSQSQEDAMRYLVNELKVFTLCTILCLPKVSLLKE